MLVWRDNLIPLARDRPGTSHTLSLIRPSGFPAVSLAVSHIHPHTAWGTLTLQHDYNNDGSVSLQLVYWEHVVYTNSGSAGGWMGPWMIVRVYL